MDKFRRYLFEQSGIEQVLKFMNVTPIDYRQSLNLSNDINLLVGLPYTNKALFLESLREQSINTTFVSHDLINERSPSDYLAEIISISKVLDQAKRVKVVLYIGERIDTPLILDRLRNFFNYARRLEPSVGVLCGWDSFGSEQGLVQRFQDYRDLYPDFVDIVTETDTGYSWKRIGVATLAHSYQRLDDVIYLMDDNLKYSPLDASDFRFNAYRLTEEVYTLFVEHIKVKEKEFINALFAQFVPIQFAGTEPNILITITIEYLRFREAMNLWDVGFTDQQQANFIEILENSNVTTTGLATKMSEFSKLYGAYMRLQDALIKVRKAYQYNDLVGQFSEYLETLNKTMISREALATIKSHQAKFDAYDQVFYANANESVYRLPTIDETRSDVVKEIAFKVVTHVESAIKDNAHKDVIKILEDYSRTNENEVQMAGANNTLIMEKLRMFKVKTDKMLPLKLNSFWRLPLKTWYVAGNYTTVDETWLARMSKYEVLLQELYKVGGCIEIVHFYLRDLKEERDYVFWVDPVEPGSYQEKIHTLYDEYKQNVSTLIFQTMTANNIGKVDKLVASVVELIAEELKRRLFDAESPATVEQINQLKRHLRTVQSQHLDYESFLVSLDCFLAVHYIDKPEAVFDALSMVDRDYQTARALISEEYYKPWDTEHFWGLNFDHAREVMHTSAAWTLSINFNASLLLLTVLVRKWCNFFK